MRRDVNPQRQQVLQNLKAALKEYGTRKLSRVEQDYSMLVPISPNNQHTDEMLDQSRKSLAMPTSRCRDVQNLKRWLDGTGCLDRQESAYLEHEHDLGNLADPLDNSVVYTESIVEDCTFWVERLIEKAFPQWRSQRYRVTSDKHVLILGPRLQNLSRVLTISAATLIILAPTVILLNLSAPDARIVASIFSAAFFLTILSFFTRAKTVEVFTAGARYEVTPSSILMRQLTFSATQQCSLRSPPPVLQKIHSIQGQERVKGRLQDRCSGAPHSLVDPIYHLVLKGCA